MAGYSATWILRERQWNDMTILVIDGQGGGFGKAVVERLVEAFPGVDIMAVGTNAVATAAMLKAGATAGA